VGKISQIKHKKIVFVMDDAYLRYRSASGVPRSWIVEPGVAMSGSSAPASARPIAREGHAPRDYFVERLRGVGNAASGAAGNVPCVGGLGR
jgi:hypothetical protein